MSKLPRILVLACFFSISLSATPSAQGPDTLWTRTYGGGSSDYGYSIRQTVPDGGYIIAGSSFSYGEGSYDIYYLKTDANGEVDWARTYGGTGTDHGVSIRQTLDGGYIIAGYTNSSGAGGYDALLAKTDSSGAVVWAYTYGGQADDRGWCVEQTLPDSGYVIAGYTETLGAGGGDAFLVRTDAEGGLLWAEAYGGTSWEEARCVIQTSPDSGFLLVGTTSSSGAGGDDVYLIRTGTEGDSIWTRTYGGAGSEKGYQVRRTFPDSGYVIIGSTYSFGAGSSDMYLVKTDRAGDTLWTRTFGGASVEYGYSVQQSAPQGGYIIAGSTRSFGEGNYDACVVKTDTNGNPIWTRTYGGSEYDDGYFVCQTTPDSGYVVVGSTRSFGAGAYDIYVMKTEPVLSGIQEGLAGGHNLVLSAGQPNPFRDRTVVRFSLGERSRVTISVHNVLGQRVATLLDAVQDRGPHAVTWDGRGPGGDALAPGIYFCCLKAGNRSTTRKMVLIR